MSPHISSFKTLTVTGTAISTLIIATLAIKPYFTTSSSSTDDMATTATENTKPYQTNTTSQPLESKPKHSLTPSQTAIIKSTVPILAAHGTTITQRFYHNLLRENPALNSVFNTTNMATGRQPAALAGALYAYAANIDNLAALGPAVELICQRHASLYIQPSQYEIVGKYLLAAMKEVLGEALTDEVAEAWATAYWQLADLFIAREAELYAKAGGWEDWAPFRIAKKTPESEEITSFYLEPVNPGVKLPTFLPGQYISIRTPVPHLGHIQPRQYSLSDAPNGKYLRVSIKREVGLDLEHQDPGEPAHPGVISNVMHDLRNEGDIVEVSHPYGDFYFDPSTHSSTTPVVLISAGVGLTALTSILNSLVKEEGGQRPISYIHAARHGKLRAFLPHMQFLASSHPNLKVVLFNKHVAEGERQGVEYHHAGRLDLSKLEKEKELHISNKSTEYFVCGPEGFMNDVEEGLKGMGVEAGRIHSEMFGPGGTGRH